MNTDYTITSGGTSSSNTVTLKYLTTGSKTVTVNYSSSGCSAVSANSSTATTISASPTVNAGTDFNLCSGQNVAMNASTNAVGPTISTSTSATYSLSAASSEYVASPTTSTNASCPIPLSVTIPAGATITGVNVSYSVTTANNQYMNENYSYLQCTSTGGVKESALTQGVGGATGTYAYSRNNLTIANGVTSS